LTYIEALQILRAVIKTWATAQSQAVYEGADSGVLPTGLQRRARRKLMILDAAVELEDLQILTSNFLEKLSGDRSGQYCMRITEQYRICFVWKQGHAYDVEIVDFH
jgi:proteic killer suppression protein